MLRAVTNLLINAVDATQSAGSIVLRASQRTLTERQSGFEPIEPGRYAVIEVEDTGAGISSENLCHIFEPFFSAKQDSVRLASGLGLAIVQRIMRDSGGYICVQSEVDRGSTFALYFPMLERQLELSSKPPPHVVGGRERILVVDDEAVQLRTARRLLERLGYCVETAQTPELALQLFGQCIHGAPFDLVVVDMVMPGALNGILTVQEMRRCRPGQRALIASGYAPEEMNALAVENGLTWLAKPYTLVALAASVRVALRAE